ncbi:MAG TPA: trypsin-like serine protease [Polyangiaceae bacterium]|nr:trypsin-like serine protease [Polyangiaceae bacterium]
MTQRLLFPLVRVALTASFCSPLLACGGAESSEHTTANAPAVPDSGDVTPNAALPLLGRWEPTAHRAHLAATPVEDSVFDLPEAELARIAEEAEHDLTWYAADGERYEALFVLEDGTAFGRRGPAPDAPPPNEGNHFGASERIPAVSIEPVEQGGLRLQAGIATDSSDDRRLRTSSTTTLTSYPARTSGAMSGSGNTQSGGCTGTKIGPRAILSAGHCVMNSAGDISFTGRFNPGQTNTTTPNGSIPRSGVYLRDWRVHRKYDYSVAFLQDSSAVVSLGWMGVMWWNSQSGYTGRIAQNLGYPCGPNNGCGAITEQTCKASPRSDKRCDGWMYGHNRPLGSNAFTSDDLLRYDNDVSKGHSGSAIFTTVDDMPNVMAVVTHGVIGEQALGPRFRTSMWNDVCSWIADPNFQSAFATHSLCHP